MPPCARPRCRGALGLNGSNTHAAADSQDSANSSGARERPGAGSAYAGATSVASAAGACLLGRPDHSACDARTGVAARLGLQIVGLLVQDDGAAEDAGDL